LVQGLLEGGTAGAGAAGGLGEHSIAAGPLEGVDLELWLLVGGGDPGVAKQMCHARDRRRTPVTGLVVRRRFRTRVLDACEAVGGGGVAAVAETYVCGHRMADDSALSSLRLSV
jgi:hypothetical protein